MDQLLVYPLSERAIVISFGNTISLEIHKKIIAARQALENKPFEGFIESVPAFNTLTVYFDPLVYAKSEPPDKSPLFAHVRDYLIQLAHQPFAASAESFREHIIPVCYGGNHGPDLLDVARTLKLDPVEIIRAHSQVKYTVFMMGFVPGFAYLGELPEALTVVRRPTPRSKVAAGSLGIAGRQTGIYPIEVPGGWQLIGQTPLTLFNPAKPSPALLSAGDQVVFNPISAEEFKHLKEQEK